MTTTSINRVLMSALVFLALVFCSFSDAQNSPKTAGNSKILSDLQQPVPPEVQKIIDETMSGKHGIVNSSAWMVSFGFDSTTQLSDLKAGKPIRVYGISRDSLVKLDENAPLSQIVTPMDIWTVPLLLHGKCATYFSIERGRTGKWHFSEIAKCKPEPNNELQKMNAAWPTTKGWNPVLIYFGPREFYHIPEKDDYNLTPLYRYQVDSLSSASDTSYGVLLSSKKTLRYLRAHLPPLNTGKGVPRW